MIQPADVSWNAPFKCFIQEYFDEWMLLTGRHEVRKNGNPKAPGMNVYLKWIMDAWKSISNETIVKSFKVCGITNATDGSEDNLIRCFSDAGKILTGTANSHKQELTSNLRC